MAGLASGCELAGPLQHAADPKQRTAALIATLSLNDQEATPLLRLALKDPEDDVRLLAYALLNRKEKSIEARIRYRNAQLGSCVPEQVFSQHKALAHDYWALAHLGAPQGSTLLLLCARAHEHVQAALQLRPRDGGLQFLLGRILLIEMKLDAATEAFEKARQSGVDRRQIEPFLAEISFLTRQYFAVNNHLAQAGSGVHRLRLDKVSTYWERPSHDARPDHKPSITLLLEGTYPFVRGGVSGWVHQLIEGLPEFELFAGATWARSRVAQEEARYTLPPNVRDLQLPLPDGRVPS